MPSKKKKNSQQSKEKKKPKLSPSSPVSRNHSRSMKPKLQFLSVFEGTQARSGEVDSRLQAGDVLVIGGIDVGKDAVGSLSTYVSMDYRH